MHPYALPRAIFTMTDDKLRKLERTWKETRAVQEGLRYLRECQRAGSLELCVEAARGILRENTSIAEAREYLREHQPYAWTGFAHITRSECNLHVIEGKDEFSINLNPSSRHSTLRDIAFSHAIAQYDQLHIIEGSNGQSPLQATHHRIDCNGELASTPCAHDIYNTLCLDNGVHFVRESTLSETWHGLGFAMGYDIPLIYESRRRAISTAALLEGTILRRERKREDTPLGNTASRPFYYENGRVFISRANRQIDDYEWFDADNFAQEGISSVDFVQGWPAPSNLRYLRENKVNNPSESLVMLHGTGKIGVEIPITMLDALRRLRTAIECDSFMRDSRDGR